jgi:hypothetical protein
MFVLLNFCKRLWIYLTQSSGFRSKGPILGQDVGQGHGDGEEAEGQVGQREGGDERVPGCSHLLK